MNENFDLASRAALIRYRIERAHKTFDEVEILINNGLYSTAVNRLYYAVYYAAIALMVKDGLYPSTHAGVRAMLGLHYIRTGKIELAVGSNYAILYERRHRCDYDDFVEATYEEVRDLSRLAKSFIDSIDKLINE